VGWEADLINYFRNHADEQELSGERDTPTGRARSHAACSQVSDYLVIPDPMSGSEKHVAVLSHCGTPMSRVHTRAASSVANLVASTRAHP